MDGPACCLQSLPPAVDGPAVDGPAVDGPAVLGAMARALGAGGFIGALLLGFGLLGALLGPALLPALLGVLTCLRSLLRLLD